VFDIQFLIDSCTGMSYLQNQIQHKKEVMKVKTVFMCHASIRCHLFLKLRKVDKGDCVETVESAFSCVPNFKSYLRRIKTSH